MKSKSERVVRGNRRRVVAAGLALCVAGLFTPKSETDVLQAKSLGTEAVGYCALKSVQSNNKGGAEIKVEWSSPSGEAPFDPRVTPAFSGGGLEPTSLDLIGGVHDGRVSGLTCFNTIHASTWMG